MVLHLYFIFSNSNKVDTVLKGSCDTGVINSANNGLLLGLFNVWNNTQGTVYLITIT